MIITNPYYGLIKDYYGDKTATRSGVKLIKHIDEGILYLQSWGQSQLVVDAFCIHPIVQNGDYQLWIADQTTEQFELAQEYADKANAYLCRPENDWIVTPFDVKMHVGNMSRECAYMLLADKVQNQKDFRYYHWMDHERADQLETYFNLWIKTLREHYL